jgi:hypothetical protein
MISDFDIDRDPGNFTAFRAGVDADHNGYPDIAIVEDEGSYFNRRNHLVFYKESSVARRLKIVGTFPSGGEAFHIGSVRFIDWACGVPAGSTGAVALELSVDGPGGPWTEIAGGLPNNGRFQWTIDAAQPSDACYIRYTVTTATDEDSFTTAVPFRLID